MLLEPEKLTLQLIWKNNVWKWLRIVLENKTGICAKYENIGEVDCEAVVIELVWFCHRHS